MIDAPQKITAESLPWHAPLFHTLHTLRTLHTLHTRHTLHTLRYRTRAATKQERGSVAHFL